MIPCNEHRDATPDTPSRDPQDHADRSVPLILAAAGPRAKWLCESELDALAASDARLRLVTVRMGSARFVCAAQDAPYLIGAITAADRDAYVRDVCLCYGIDERTNAGIYV